jgi:hypothetical protein
MSDPSNLRPGVLSYTDHFGREVRLDISFATSDLCLTTPAEVKREGHFFGPGSKASFSFLADYVFAAPARISSTQGGNARDRRRWRRRREAIERAIMRAFRMPE